MSRGKCISGIQNVLGPSESYTKSMPVSGSSVALPDRPWDRSAPVTATSTLKDASPICTTEPGGLGGSALGIGVDATVGAGADTVWVAIRRRVGSCVGAIGGAVTPGAVSTGATAVGGTIVIGVAVRSANAVGVVVVGGADGGVCEVHDNTTIRKPASTAMAARDNVVRARSTGRYRINVGFPRPRDPKLWTKPGGTYCWRSG